MDKFRSVFDRTRQAQTHWTHASDEEPNRPPRQQLAADAAAGGSVNVYGHNGVSSGRGVVHYRRRGTVCRESVATALI